MLKRPSDAASTERRSSLQDAYGKPGFLGTMWNKYVCALEKKNQHVNTLKALPEAHPVVLQHRKLLKPEIRVPCVARENSHS